MEFKRTLPWKFVATFVLMVGTMSIAVAEGNETLGPCSVSIAGGSGFVAKGVGLTLSQPGIINLNVQPGVTINQVFLYWEGQHTTPDGDGTITVAGSTVTGTIIGGPDYFFDANNVTPVYSTSYRADITALNIVVDGANAIAVEDMNFDFANNGAGILVIYDDGTLNSDLFLHDGNDLAYRFSPAPRNAMAAQTFTFDPAPNARTAQVTLFCSSVQGTISTGGLVRANRVSITVGPNTTDYDNVLNSSDGEEWDTYVVPVNIPAGETTVTVQTISGPGGDEDPNTLEERPASFAWIASGFSIPRPEIINNAAGEAAPAGFALLQNYPNPFNPSTEIHFSIPLESRVTLRVYNTLGQEVKTLIDGQLASGQHRARWDAMDNTGSAVSSGVYYYRLRAGEYVSTKKMGLFR